MGREKKAESRKPKQLSRKDKATILAVFLLLAAFAIFAFDTALSNKTFVYSGNLLRIDEHEELINLGRVGGNRSFALRYYGSTEFTQAGARIIPSIKLMGMKVHVHYRKSLFAGDYAFKVELGE